MNLFQVIAHIYTDKNTLWIDSIEEDEFAQLHPFIITKFLSMNKSLSNIIKILDKYSFILEPKKFLFVAWAVVPKQSTAPFVKYIKKEEEVQELSFLYEKIKNNTKVYGNDFKAIKKYLDKDIQSDMKKYFIKFAIDKKYWKKYGLEYPKFEKKEEKPVGLDAWF